MTSAPADLLSWRSSVLAATGLAGSDVGIVGDGAHQRTGGYHEGRDVLVAIGRYHPGARPGDPNEDYSARTARDRRGLDDSASAADIGRNWRAGVAAWLRFNGLLVAALHAGDPALAPIRAVNYSPDGVQCKRTDRERGWAVESSTDLVTIHTHIEWYRDTEGQRAACCARLLQLILIANGGSMTDADIPDTHRLASNGETWGRALVTGEDPALYLGSGATAPNWSKTPNVMHHKLDQIIAAAAADQQRDAAMLAMVQALTAGGTSVDTTVVVSAIQAASAAESQTVQALQAEVAHLRTQLGAALSAAGQAVAG